MHWGDCDVAKTDDCLPSLDNLFVVYTNGMNMAFYSLEI